MIREKVRLCLQDIGVFLSDSEWKQIDLNLLDYIQDSLQFINFIIEVEERCGCVLPDELLQMDLLKSLNLFTETIQTAMECKNNEPAY